MPGTDSARNTPGKSPPKTLDREETGGISERAAGADSTAPDMAASGCDCGADQAYLLDMGTDREKEELNVYRIWRRWEGKSLR